MGRKKKFLFTETKMFSSRIEKSDFDKISERLQMSNITIQDFVNTVVRGYISGSFNIIDMKKEVTNG